MIQRRDIGIAVSLLAAALAIRLVFAARLVFPPLDDPAFYIQTARHAAEGRGLVSDVIWNYFVPFSSVTHPSHEFWMPLATLLMATSLKLFGDTLFTAQLPGLISGALLPVLVYALGRWLWPSQRRWAVLAALLGMAGAIPVYQAGSADSAALYTLLSASAIALGALVMARARAAGPGLRDRVLMAAGVGVLGGLSYLARSHGSLVLASIGLVWLLALRRDLKQAALFIGGLTVGAGIVIGPWWWRNVLAFGAIQPFPLTLAAAATDYAVWFNSIDLPSLEKLWAGGLSAVLSLRWAALGHDLGVMGLITFPFGLIGLPVMLARREWLFRLAAVYMLMLWLVVSGLFPVPALTGSFYHSAGSLVPFAALGSIVVIKALFERRRWRLLSVSVYAVLILLVGGQSLLAWPSVWADSRANEAKFAVAAQWLTANVPPDQPIITNEAHSLNYASGYAALTLPYAEDLAAVTQLADRYGARFVVVLGSTGLYPQTLDQSAYAIKRWVEGDIAIYELR